MCVCVCVYIYMFDGNFIYEPVPRDLHSSRVALTRPYCPPIIVSHSWIVSVASTFLVADFTFTGVDRFVWYGLAWSWLMVPRAEMLLDTLARIIRLIRNNGRHCRYNQIQKKGDESSLDLGCKIRTDIKEI